MHTDYLVYEHWRTDTMQPFYVGKSNARKRRAGNMSMRSDLHKRVVAKLKREGHSVIVKIVDRNLPEVSAHLLERMRISTYRAAGIAIVNRTNGGDGMSGYKFTDEQRARCSAAQKVARNTPEARARIGAVHKGRVVTSETREKLRITGQARAAELSKQRAGEGNPFFGRKHSEETRAKIRAALAQRREEAARPSTI
jgi:hypothetical protein